MTFSTIFKRTDGEVKSSRACSEQDVTAHRTEPFASHNLSTDAMIRLWRSLLVLFLALLQTGAAFALEEVKLAECTGFVWKLQFQSNETSNISFHTTDAGTIAPILPAILLRL